MDDKRVAFIQACRHKEIVDQARDSFVDGIEKCDLSRDRIDFFEVPGSLEIPLMTKRPAGTGRYAVMIVAGLIVDGGIYRHEFVTSAVIEALMKAQLDSEVPIISIVLTPRCFHEHDDHRKFFHNHFRIKGAEAASAWIRTLENTAIIDAFDSSPSKESASL